MSGIRNCDFLVKGMCYFLTWQILQDIFVAFIAFSRYSEVLTSFMSHLVPTCFICWSWLNVEAKVKDNVAPTATPALNIRIQDPIRLRLRLRLRLCPSELSAFWAQWKCHPAVFQLLGPMHSRLPRLCDWAMYLLAARCSARYWNGLWFLATHGERNLSWVI